MFDQPARPRRRLRRLLWPVLIMGAVALAVVASSAGDSSRAEIDYLETLRTQVTELSRDGDALRDVVNRLSSVERVEFETAIETIQEDLAGASVFANQEVPSLSLVSIRSAYRLALASWTEGLSAFRRGLLDAADQPGSALALDIVANALADMRAGDALYEVLIAEIGREDTPNPLGEMPEVSLSPRAGPLATISALLVSAVRSDGDLGHRPGLALSQLLSDPAWEVNPNGQAVVPATETIIFSVVVTNIGNVASEAGSVVLTLSSADDSRQVEQPFTSLGPEQQVTVTFEVVAVARGGVYQVEASLPDWMLDTDLTDNRIQVQFTVNP